MIPKVKLKSLEKLWLKRLCQKMIANEKINYRILRSELDSKLPLNFHPNEIDRRIVGYGGENITLLGFHSMLPKLKMISKTNIVIQAIRKYLMQNPETTKISSINICNSIKDVTEKEVGMILKLISNYGNFWRGASQSNSYFGFSEIDVSDENVFNQYIYIDSIEELIQRNYDNFEKQLSNADSTLLDTKQIIDTGLHKDGIHIKPLFTSRIAQIDVNLCFVLMPFNESWSERVYVDYIREVIEKLGLQCLRADNLTGSIIIEDIWTKINQAAIIIADVTNKNPNVMYELGIAHTLGKPVILITQDTSNIPFDFSHLRHYEYSDNLDGYRIFNRTLKNLILSTYMEFYPSKSFTPI